MTLHASRPLLDDELGKEDLLDFAFLHDRIDPPPDFITNQHFPIDGSQGPGLLARQEHQ